MEMVNEVDGVARPVEGVVEGQVAVEGVQEGVAVTQQDLLMIRQPRLRARGKIKTKARGRTTTDETRGRGKWQGGVSRARN